MLFIERGQVDVLDGAFVVIDKVGVFPACVGMNRQ